MSSGFSQQQISMLKKSPHIQNLMKAYQSGSGKKHMKGKGFFDDLWAAVKKTGQDVGKFLKDTQLISRGAKAVAAVAPFLGLPELTSIATGVSGVAGAIGFGKHMKGGNALLSIYPPDRRLGAGKMRGKGQVFAQNGTVQNSMMPNLQGAGRMMMTRGAGVNSSVYGSISDMRSRIKG